MNLKKFALMTLGLVLYGSFQMALSAQTETEEIFEPATVNVPSAVPVEGSWIEMYGVRLSTATRDAMRQALHAQGVKPLRQDARYWVDIYDAKALLAGASQFYLGYSAATQKLAFAEYAFPSFMDSRQTQQILKKVVAKYGAPHETLGDLAMGAYTARWIMTEGMQIQLVREWPETSTFLKFSNPAVDRELKAELAQEMGAQAKPRVSDGASTTTWLPASAR
jgi:hypothetical protein